VFIEFYNKSLWPAKSFSFFWAAPKKVCPSLVYTVELQLLGDLEAKKTLDLENMKH